eukprot:Opistho-2@4489
MAAQMGMKSLLAATVILSVVSFSAGGKIFGGFFNFACSSASEIGTNGYVSSAVDNFDVACRTLNPGAGSGNFLSCAGKYVLNPSVHSAGDKQLQFGYALTNGVNGVNNILVKLNEDGDLQFVMSSSNNVADAVATILWIGGPDNATFTPGQSNKGTVALSEIACSANAQPYYLGADPVDCAYSNYTEYSDCTLTCGSGTKYRTRTITTQAKYGGVACDAATLNVSTSCNTDPCPVDCQWGPYSNFSSCSSACGAGTQTRTRQILVQAEHNGALCTGSASDSQACTGVTCPVDCAWGNYTAFGACSNTCGAGKKTRTRSILTQAENGGALCSGSASEEADCTGVTCPVNCEYNSFGDYSTCTKTCGTGTQTRVRTVKVQAENGGTLCTDPASETINCNTDACLVNCTNAVLQNSVSLSGYTPGFCIITGAPLKLSILSLDDFSLLVRFTTNTGQCNVGSIYQIAASTTTCTKCKDATITTPLTFDGENSLSNPVTLKGCPVVSSGITDIAFAN